MREEGCQGRGEGLAALAERRRPLRPILAPPKKGSTVRQSGQESSKQKQRDNRNCDKRRRVKSPLRDFGWIGDLKSGIIIPEHAQLRGQHGPSHQMTMTVGVGRVGMNRS